MTTAPTIATIAVVALAVPALVGCVPLAAVSGGISDSSPLPAPSRADDLTDTANRQAQAAYDSLPAGQQAQACYDLNRGEGLIRARMFSMDLDTGVTETRAMVKRYGMPAVQRATADAVQTVLDTECW